VVAQDSKVGVLESSYSDGLMTRVAKRMFGIIFHLKNLMPAKYGSLAKLVIQYYCTQVIPDLSVMYTVN